MLRLSNSLVYWGLTPQQQPGSYQGGEMMMMKSVFWWRKPEYPEETTDLRQVTDENSTRSTALMIFYLQQFDRIGELEKVHNVTKFKYILTYFHIFVQIFCKCTIGPIVTFSLFLAYIHAKK